MLCQSPCLQHDNQARAPQIIRVILGLLAIGTMLAGEEGRAESKFDVPSLEECLRDTEQIIQIVKMANRQLSGRSGSFDVSQVMSLLKQNLQDLDMHQEGEPEPLADVLDGGVPCYQHPQRFPKEGN